MGFRKVTYEGDVQVIVNEVNEGPCMSKYGHFVEGIKMELRSLESAKFTYVKWEANNVAHRLAKMATTHATEDTWLEIAPLEICGIVRREESTPLWFFSDLDVWLEKMMIWI